MKLTSIAFEHNGDIPSKYTCEGENINPPLVIDDVLEGVKSFVLFIDDPDATAGGTFDHWILWNISAETREIKEGSVPDGASQGINGFGNKNYGGCCPPEGADKHRYMFKLYALDRILDISGDIEKEKIEKEIEGHILDEAILTGLFSR